MTNTGQDARALAIRDRLVLLIRTHGSMQEVSGMAGRLAVCKVLSVQWDDEGRAEVMSFSRGPWEAEALAKGADPSPAA